MRSRGGDRALAAIALGGLCFLPEPALAAGLDGKSLSLVWGIPFVGILLSIALLPQLAGHFWEHHMPAIAGFWIALTLIPLAVLHGAGVALDSAFHVVLLEYLPFVLLLFALFTIAGGIVVGGNLHGTPAVNTTLLAIGTVLASLIGTTGASMVLIRPLIRANDSRRHNAHVVVFFIFLVANVGGALTPLGDPPLFLGFLRGVSFFWTTTHLLAETLFVAVILLALFYVLDRTVFARDDEAPPLRDPTPDTRLHLRGKVNLILLAILVGTIILSGIWRPGISFQIGSAKLELQNLLRDGMMVVLGLVSLAITPKTNRIANEFTWAPIKEVATIFAAIFVCLVPVAAMLAAGQEGPFAPLLSLVTRPDGTPIAASYFWMTGILSSLLDNAPTYIVFFELAGGDPVRLMGPLAGTLAAISSGAVFMGANTYIGNAPNFMVYAIARQQGVRMPSFFGYMAWSGGILVPIFCLATFIFFR